MQFAPLMSFDVTPSQTRQALTSRRDALGLTYVTDEDLLRLAHAFWEQAQGGSFVMSFAQFLSMDFRIPEATIEHTLAPASPAANLDEAPVEDRLLVLINTHRSLRGLRARRAERQARRDIATAAKRRRDIFLHSA